MIFNTGIALVAAVATHSEDIGESVGAVISAPIVEESAKALILVILFFWKKDEFDGIVARAEADAEFRQALVADLEATLAQEGYEPERPLLDALRRRFADK